MYASDSESAFDAALNACSWREKYPELPSVVHFEQRQEWAIMAARYLTQHCLMPYIAQLQEGLGETYNVNTHRFA